MDHDHQGCIKLSTLATTSSIRETYLPAAGDTSERTELGDGLRELRCGLAEFEADEETRLSGGPRS